MLHLRSAQSRRGMTVLGLLLLIIALVIAAVFLVRYLRSRPAAAFVPPTVVNVTLDV